MDTRASRGLRKSLDPFGIGSHAGGVEVRLHASVDEFRATAEPVYRRDPIAHTVTPQHRRGHGYGSAVTAAACERAHRSGSADVVIFADVANPTSNAIYQNIGFESVCDQVESTS